MGKTVQEIYSARVAGGLIKADPAQQVVLPLLEELRVHLNGAPPRPSLRALFGKQPDGPGGLYLWGGVGRGKSMLMDLFVGAVSAPKRRVHFHAFMQEIHAGIHAARKSGAQDALIPVAAAVAADVKLLAFDEMQINDITDAMIVGRLFEQLFQAGVVIITTSNRAPDGLYENGLNRQLFLPFIDLLKTRMAVHELVSVTDYRQDVLVGSQVYFSPADGVARDEINRIWAGLSGGESHELTLHVQGRKVVLPRFHNGVARATFWDLCGHPLGAADFLALADAVRVLILDDVPRLGRGNYNEARRFVILIDTLYEARVQLVMSAADVPDRLYLEGSGAFEFGRTASRLREMQGEGWGCAPQKSS